MAAHKTAPSALVLIDNNSRHRPSSAVLRAAADDDDPIRNNANNNNHQLNNGVHLISMQADNGGVSISNNGHHHHMHHPLIPQQQQQQQQQQTPCSTWNVLGDGITNNTMLAANHHQQQQHYSDKGSGRDNDVDVDDDEEEEAENGAMLSADVNINRHHLLMAANNAAAGAAGPMSIMTRQISAISSEGGPLVTIGGDDDEGSSSSGAEGGGGGPTRAAFANHAEFLAGMISMAVGLGNVWRFPYLCQRNGGGAFLIPYVILLVLEGMPLSLIEIGLGQIKHKGSIGVWREIDPRLGGLGISSTVVSFLVGLYYNVVITWCLYYLFRSFTTTLPWSECPLMPLTHHQQLMLLDNSNSSSSSSSLTPSNTTMTGLVNVIIGDAAAVVPECAGSSETQYFWYREALDSSESIGDLGGIKLWMLACLFLAWVIVFLTMRKGIQSSGKVLYITAFFPYAILTIFFFRAVTLRGAGTGLLHLLTPKLHLLLDPVVWMDAATQVFYSMSLAFGGIIAYSSYLPRTNDCTKDAVLTSGINLVTSIFTVTVVFSILGFKATVTRDNCLVKFNDTIGGALPDLDIMTEHMENVPHGYDAGTIQDAFKACNLTEELDKAAEGTGLAFIVFTQAIVEFPGAPFWSVIFFLMLLALGFGSQFGTMQGVVTNIFDVFQGKVINSKVVLMGILCVVCFLFDLIFVTGAGEYWVFLFDTYAAKGLILIGFVQVVALTYYYGWRRFIDEIHSYTGRRPGLYWTICWRFVSPIIIAVIFVASLVNLLLDSANYNIWDREAAVGKNVPLPPWALGMGIFLMMLSFVPLPVVFLIEFWRNNNKKPTMLTSSSHRQHHRHHHHGGAHVLGTSSSMTAAGRLMAPAVHRVATTTSTQPMMSGMEVDEEDDALNVEDDDGPNNGPTVLCVLQDSEQGLDDDDEIPRYKGIF